MQWPAWPGLSPGLPSAGNPAEIGDKAVGLGFQHPELRHARMPDYRSVREHACWVAAWIPLSDQREAGSLGIRAFPVLADRMTPRAVLGRHPLTRSDALQVVGTLSVGRHRDQERGKA